jgi:hypothetical protein
MKLSDVMSHTDLATYPKIALVIFLAVFAAVMAKLARTPREEMTRCGRMALDDEGAKQSEGTNHA